jgi:23S rRNA pseudouridine1911/1915/1917 synthase
MADTADQIFHVTDDQANRTVAALLRVWLAGQSWSQVHKLIDSRRVQVNGNLCLDAPRRLQPGDVVKIMPHAQAKPPSTEQIRIRHLDHHLVVVEKPALMTTLRHPDEDDWPERRKQKQQTLDELIPRLIAWEEKTKRGPQGYPKLRAVHRLDRETSGLMVFARTVDAERHLGHQFKKHTIHRLYRAIALGKITAARTIESNLVPDRGDRRRGSTTLPNVGKHAVTHIKPIEGNEQYTLIECKLETGRTHQIRIHLSEIGHPLCGEKVYNKPLFGDVINDPSGAPRTALHAAELGFIHPISGLSLMFKQPWPPDLAQLWERLYEDRVR